MSTQSEGQEPTDATAGTGQEPTTAPQSFSADYVKELRQEAADYRVKLKEASDKLAEFEQAKMSEAERLQAQLQAAQAEREQAATALRQARAEAAVAQAAAKHGFPVSLAVKLTEVEFDDNGQPLGVAEAVAKLATEYPQLVAQSAPTPTTAVMNGARPKKSNLTPDDLRGKSPAWINENWDEVKNVLNK